jgi:riboflavin synthase
VRLHVATGELDMSDVRQGDSIAVSGVCLTAVALGPHEITADVSGETLARTVLGQLKAGDAVNLEKALMPTSRLGGHLVSGHVDGVGKVVQRASDARSIRFRIKVPAELARYIAQKGSVCVDGISLTVNTVAGDEFDLNIVPHTAERTTLSQYQPGRAVNIEVDVIARYLERLIATGDVATGGVTMELLRRHGFADR